MSEQILISKDSSQSPSRRQGVMGLPSSLLTYIMTFLSVLEHFNWGKCNQELLSLVRSPSAWETMDLQLKNVFRVHYARPKCLILWDLNDQKSFFPTDLPLILSRVQVLHLLFLHTDDVALVTYLGRCIHLQECKIIFDFSHRVELHSQQFTVKLLTNSLFACQQLTRVEFLSTRLKWLSLFGPHLASLPLYKLQVSTMENDHLLPVIFDQLQQIPTLNEIEFGDEVSAFDPEQDETDPFDNFLAQKLTLGLSQCLHLTRIRLRDVWIHGSQLAGLCKLPLEELEIGLYKNETLEQAFQALSKRALVRLSLTIPYRTTQRICVTESTCQCFWKSQDRLKNLEFQGMNSILASTMHWLPRPENLESFTFQEQMYEIRELFFHCLIPVVRRMINLETWRCWSPSVPSSTFKYFPFTVKTIYQIAQDCMPRLRILELGGIPGEEVDHLRKKNKNLLEILSRRGVICDWDSSY